MDTLAIIARVRCPFPTKFGIPRQSGLVEDIRATIEFESAYRNPDALRGIEAFSHLWIIWGFSESERPGWSATVRPPRLGGNERVGVFATRSPFRPNAIGLSCVRLLGVERDEKRGGFLAVAGADMMDGTPVYDIKPYLPFADSRPDASGGFAEEKRGYALEVAFPEPLLARVPSEHRAALIGALEQDPRPAYQNDANRVYGFAFLRFDIRFTVSGGVLTVREVAG